MCMLLSMHRKPTDLVENKKDRKGEQIEWDAVELIIQVQRIY